jgi:hypothetical protein
MGVLLHIRQGLLKETSGGSDIESQIDFEDANWEDQAEEMFEVS